MSTKSWAEAGGRAVLYECRDPYPANIEYVTILRVTETTAVLPSGARYFLADGIKIGDRGRKPSPRRRILIAPDDPRVMQAKRAQHAARTDRAAQVEAARNEARAAVELWLEDCKDLAHTQAASRALHNLLGMIRTAAP